MQIKPLKGGDLKKRLKLWENVCKSNEFKGTTENLN